MKIRCGTDATTVSRIEKALSRGEERFLERVFTPAERAYCAGKGKGSAASLAARFAAKEAVSKALGTGISGGVSFRDIEVQRDARGAPHIVLTGEAAHRYAAIGGEDLSISLSHERDLALAFCVILCADPAVPEW